MNELTLEEAALAWAQGKRVEAEALGLSTRIWAPIHSLGTKDGYWNPNVFADISGVYKFRLAPEPPAKKWRVWGIEDARANIGKLVKRIHTNNAQLIVGIKWPTHVDVGQSENFTVEYLAEHFEHSIDHGKTWLPCGVEVNT
jgi:hypothetical protein